MTLQKALLTRTWQRSSKRSRPEMLEILLCKVNNMAANRKRNEAQPRNMLDKAIQKEVSNNPESRAYDN